MFKNKNYEWMKKWEEPMNMGVVKSTIYYTMLYMKIVSQATDEDKMEIEKLRQQDYRNRGYNNDNVTPGNLLGRWWGILASAEYICTWFIRNTVMQALHDDTMRQEEVRMEQLQMRVDETERAINGGRTDREIEAEELKREQIIEQGQTEEQKTFVRARVAGGYSGYMHPTLAQAQAQRLIESYDEVITVKSNVRLSGIAKVPVHTRIYDKCMGYYTAEVWSRNYIGENGRFVHKVAYATTLSDIKDYARRLQAMCSEIEVVERPAVKMELPKPRPAAVFVRQEGTNQATASDRSNETKKQKPVNIDKVNKALGLSESNDDLNGDIF